MTDLILVAYDRTDTQGVADSVVTCLRRDRGYEAGLPDPHVQWRSGTWRTTKLVDGPITHKGDVCARVALEVS